MMIDLEFNRRVFNDLANVVRQAKRRIASALPANPRQLKATQPGISLEKQRWPAPA